ncbi:MAG: hypothetical protein IJV46_08490 [Acidaminococcaceae bacterium]|nr:hypothetical protein [Acidaminococcaceae bacterium]
MKLWVYYLFSLLWGILTLVFSFGGAFAFTQYIDHISLKDGGVVTGGHMSIMEFVIPLLLIGLACFVLYLVFSLFCIFRRLRNEDHRLLHFLFSLLLYLFTTVATLPLLGMFLGFMDR